MLPSLQIWDTINCIFLVRIIQLFQLTLILQGTKLASLKAFTTNMESHSSHNLCQPFLYAISTETIAPTSSTCNDETIPTYSEKDPRAAARLSLKMPPHAATPGQPNAAPSLLHLTQPHSGGFQTT